MKVTAIKLKRKGDLAVDHEDLDGVDVGEGGEVVLFSEGGGLFANQSQHLGQS